MAIQFTISYPGDNDIVSQGSASMSRNSNGTATYTLPEGSKEFKGNLPSWCGIPVRAIYVLPGTRVWMVRDDDGPDHSEFLQKVGSRYESPEIWDFLARERVHRKER